MDQRTAAPAAPTLLRHVRRALLVVGGAVVWWLVFLSGGAAHADDTGHAAPRDHAQRIDSAPAGQALGRTVGRTVESSAEGVSIGIWRVGEDVQVYVTDDGPGVPIEDWESVFEPFVRIEGRGRSRGSGIGLFAARRLMHAMGGRAFLEPNGFGGSRFVVALPASD